MLVLFFLACLASLFVDQEVASSWVGSGHLSRDSQRSNRFVFSTLHQSSTKAWLMWIYILGLLNCVAFSFNIFVHRSGFIFLAYMNLLFAWPCPKIIDLPFTTCWNPTAIYQMHPLSQWACSTRQRGLKALIHCGIWCCLPEEKKK